MMTDHDHLHGANWANQGTSRIWDFVAGEAISTFCVLYPNTQKISPTNDVTFLDKSHGEWNKAEKPTVVPVSYEGSHDEEGGWNSLGQ